MLYILCGLIIGVVMGLTGAGGALVAIPLFIQLLGMTLKEASIYSLLAVVIASFLNFISQKKEADYKVALLIVTLSAIGSYFGIPLKKYLPEFVIASLLVSISLFALYSIWFNDDKEIISSAKGAGMILSIPVGLLLGLLTTLTGLGGGVLMMPIFIKFYSFGQVQAVATSLLAVSLSSLASLLIQMKRGGGADLGLDVFYLVAGIIGAVFILKMLLIKLPRKLLVNIRKYVFTIVVILAIVKIIQS